LTTDRDRGPGASAALLAAVLVGTHLLHWLLPGLFEPLAARVTDRFFGLRSGIESLRPAYDGTVVHVDIDDRSLREREDFYLDRADHARLVRNLGRAGIAAQFHDVVFAAPGPPAEDRELEEATAEAANTYYGMAVGLSAGRAGTLPPDPDPAFDSVRERIWWRPEVTDAARLPEASRYLVTYPRLAAASRGLGFLDVVPDRDGVYRRVPLLARAGESGFVPSLSLRVICDFLGVEPGRIEVRPGRSITLRGARRPGSEESTDIAIPVDRAGRMIVNYIGPWGSMTHYPFFVIYDASDDRFMLEDLRAELEGRIAVVSWTATGAGDIGAVPTDPLFPLSGLHASVLNTILTENFLHEVGTLTTLLLVELPLLALLLAAAMRLRTVPFVIVSMALVPAYFVVAGLLFLYADLVLNVPRPVMTIAGATVLVAAYQYHLEARRRAVLRSTFNAFFPPSVVDKVMAHAEDLVDTAQKKELSVLFSDIRGFTKSTSEMEPGHVRDLLNEYFDRMIEIVFRHEGTLDKFIGDGLMVFFGDPETQPDHAARSVRAAIEMQQATRELSKAWVARGDMQLEIRVGINTGVVIVGNMGSARRLSYTALGGVVNIAQRLESNAPVGGILISAHTHELMDGAVPAKKLAPIRVKGIDDPLEVYEVVV
jgi:adenylate cyclase